MSAQQNKPNVVIAIVLGLIAPGAGLYYAGRPKLGVLAMLLFVGVVVGLPYLAVHEVVDAARLPSLMAASALLLTGVAAGTGAVVAVRAVPSLRPPWLHPWWVAGVVVLLWALTSQLRSRVVVPQLVSFARVDDSLALVPGVKPGGLLVVKRVFAPAEVTAGAMVLVGEKVAVVQSTDSGIVLTDGTKVSPADILGVAVPAR